MSVIKPLYVAADGIQSLLSDGSVINAGGISGNVFEVGGRGLLFDDGTSSSPTGTSISLQAVYTATVDGAGVANIKLAAGKDLSILDANDDAVFFRIEADTGKVLITGDLEVQGNSTIIDTVIQDSDHWQISPKASSTIALKIEPDLGVTPLVDLMSVRRTFGSTPVFRIDASGNLIASQNLTITGTVNGVDVAALNTSVTGHFSGLYNRHDADDVDIAPISTLPTASTVQEALVGLDARITSLSTTGFAKGYEHTQSAVSNSWVIAHNNNTMRASVVIYDTSWNQLIPDSVHVVDVNTVFVTFGRAIAGTALVTTF